MRKRKFAWLPLPAHKYHEEPESSDPLMKALCNGWHSDGWLFLEPYDLIVNLWGDRFRERCDAFYVEKANGFWWVTERKTKHNYAQTECRLRAKAICRQLNCGKASAGPHLF